MELQIVWLSRWRYLLLEEFKQIVTEKGEGGVFICSKMMYRAPKLFDKYSKPVRAPGSDIRIP
ncbi:hypothetical protein FRX31_007454 [Thalictrum thalictroides]|uniref:Uncharacterized protein n=1 Tax=Thalictrum thalictroides TaxID=46969 RepID=A0A7J6X0T8_THATH|nr:hypothetical protein FRX31_007454 [Thalictrum thalictroides]